MLSRPILDNFHFKFISVDFYLIKILDEHLVESAMTLLLQD